ncbi:DUF3857 and transglutaminase domain-containing protein [Teredinibacter turnerae]|uniref:DUF3857 and transglutaminase domain-containing protein n=1 Tax=Teredinibacter turnerae TaxID=2426 RepID=UPI00037C708F|nr:DUF3857 and transglutaminase domain-containing protein [Teredinibacter turnerae]
MSFVSRLLSCSAFILSLSICLHAQAAERLGPPLQEQRGMQFAQQGAEALYSIKHATLDSDHRWTRTHYISIRINDTDSARDYGRIAIPYNHFYSSAALDFANVLTAQGVLKPVSQEAIQVRTTGGGQDFYDDQSEIVFSLPDVVPGSIIEFQYTATTLKRAIETVEFDGASPFWFQQRIAKDGWRADSVAQFVYQLETPADLPLEIEVRGQYRKKPVIKSGDGSTIRRWRWNKVAAVELESAMLPGYEVMPSIKVSTSRDWGLINRWTWEKVGSKLGSTAAIASAIAEMALPADATREQKINAVYQYVNTKVRYVFAHLGRGGYEPHYPDETLLAGYGDCKDQAVLTVALLKALGVKSHVAVVETPRAGTSRMDLVRLIFDHMIVWVPPATDGKALWLDTTGDRTLFPGMANQMIGQPALIIDSGNGIVTAIDAELAPNLARLELIYSESPEGSLVEARYLPQGAYEQVLRSWWQHDANRESSLQRLMQGIFNNSSEYALNASVHNAESLWNPLEIRAQFKFNKNSATDTPLTYGASFRQIYSLAGDLSMLQVPATRVNTYYDPLSIRMEQQVVFKGGVTSTPLLVQTAESVKATYFSLEQNGRVEGADFILDLVFSRGPLRLSVDDYREYYQSLVNLGGQGGWLVSMVDDPKKAAEQGLEETLATVEEDSWQAALAKAKHYIDLGQFEDALPPAQAAVELAPENGEAWFVLGTVQGFNTDIEASNASFVKAKQLGYQP